MDKRMAKVEAEIRKLAADQTMRTANVSAEVLAERLRQIRQEHWTPEHDDQWTDGQLARAACAYAVPHANYAGQRWFWPDWDLRWFKPKDRRRDLVRAAALLLAEIERLDRKAGSK